LTVSLGKRVRRIELQRGEAFFEVAHDVARPFEVHAANGVARAVGTQFSVEVQKDAATVSVLQGVVVVAPRTETLIAGVPADAPRLEANKSIHYGAGGNLGLVQAADVRRISAWREGKLVFDDLPLADALAEYNRYTAHKVVVGSEQIGRRRVSGVLNIGDFESLSLLLHESLGLTLVEQGGSVLLLDPEVAAPAQTLPATASRS
jgi:transmembrane sensor